MDKFKILLDKLAKHMNKKNVLIFSSIFVSTCIIISGVFVWKFYDKKENETIDYNFSKIRQQIYSPENKNEKYLNSFTDKIITDEQSAMAALEDAKDALGFKDVSTEFEFLRKQYDGRNFHYRIQQIYNGIPVPDRVVIIHADSNPKEFTLSSNYAPLKNAPTEPKIDKEQARKVAVEFMKKKYNCLEESIDTSEPELFYDSLILSRIRLSYIVNCTGISKDDVLYSRQLSIDSVQSKVYEDNSLIYSIQSEITRNGQNGVAQTFTIEQEGDKISFINEKFVSNIGSTIRVSIPIHKYKWYEDNESEIVFGNINDTINESAVDAMTNVSRALEFYYKVFRRKSFNDGDDGGEDINVYVNIEGYHDKPKNENIDTTNNAFFMKTSDGKKVIFFCIRTNNEPEYSYNLDMVGHEFTHGVINDILESKKSPFPGGLGEAYCDILGECIEDSLEGFQTDWIIGSGMRNIKSPHDTSKGKNESAYADHMNEYVHNGVAYKNSTIISHAAYLMWNGGKTGQEYSPIKDSDGGTKTLARIWYESLFYYKNLSNTDFVNCRSAVLCSAKKLQKDGEITIEQLETVLKAFSDVGVENVSSISLKEVIKGNFNLNVYDIFEEPHTNYNLKIQGKKGIVFDEDIQDSNKSLNLDVGMYTLTITNLNDSKQKQSINIVIQNDFSAIKDSVDIYTNFTKKSISPTFDSEGTPIDFSESEKERLLQLLSIANIAVLDNGNSFNVDENIDNLMYYTGIFSMNEEDRERTGDVFSVDGLIFQNSIYKIFGRYLSEENTIIENGRAYWDIFGLSRGYQFMINEIQDLGNSYYKIIGLADYYDCDEFIESFYYTALIKKDDLAQFGYFLIAQNYTDEFIYTSYLKNNIIPSLGIAKANFSVDYESKIFGWCNTTGVISAMIQDLDGNGIKELSVFYIEKQNNEGYERASLKMRIYSIENEEISLKSDVIVLDGFDNWEVDIKLYLKKYNNKTYLYIEGINKGDGSSVSYLIYRFDGNVLNRELFLYDPGYSDGGTGLYKIPNLNCNYYDGGEELYNDFAEKNGYLNILKSNLEPFGIDVEYKNGFCCAIVDNSFAKILFIKSVFNNFTDIIVTLDDYTGYYLLAQNPIPIYNVGDRIEVTGILYSGINRGYSRTLYLEMSDTFEIKWQSILPKVKIDYVFIGTYLIDFETDKQIDGDPLLDQIYRSYEGQTITVSGDIVDMTHNASGFLLELENITLNS